MKQTHQFLKYSYWVIIICLISLLSPAYASVLYPPDNPGPYHVGHMRVDQVPLSGGGITNISIWYPTADATGAVADYQTNPNVNLYTFPGPNTFILQSFFNAHQNAIPAPGLFPVIIASSGSAGVDRDRGRMQFYKRAEFLATHGFITIGYTYHTPLASFSFDIRDIANFALSPANPIYESVDTNKLVLAGISLGGYPSLSLASGNIFIAKDNRVKALILLDIVIGNNQKDYDLVGSPFNVTIPSLIYHLDYNGAANKLMNRSPGTPQFSIFQKKVHHFSTVDYCPIIDACRQVAFAKGLPDPLVSPTPDLNSTIAYSLWYHIGEYYCNTSVWQTPVPASLIPNRDNYTQEDENFRRVVLFMVSFLKTYIVGDIAYSPYLTSDYVKANFDKGDLTIQVDK